MNTEVTPMNTEVARTNVVWPAGARPEQSPIHTSNQLVLAAPPERVWAWLVRAVRWPEWYGNARDVTIEGGQRDLALGSRFSWVTFGVRVHTVVEEFVPNHRLAWSGKGLGASAYHGWVITPRDGGSHVITEETQRGLVASAGRWPLRRGLRRWHHRWLEGLGRAAAGGWPDGESEGPAR